jgi:hypothetical protein
MHYTLAVLTDEFLFSTLDIIPSADVSLNFHVLQVENG